MKVANLTVGLEVAIRKYKGWDGIDVCDRGIVIDPAYWTKTVRANRGEYSVTLRPEKRANTDGFGGFTASGIPVAVLNYRGEWTCEFVAPNKIVGTWEAHLEVKEAADAARKAAELRRLTEAERLKAAAKTINEALDAAGLRDTLVGTYVKDGDHLVIRVDAAELLAKVLGGLVEVAA